MYSLKTLSKFRSKKLILGFLRIHISLCKIFYLFQHNNLFFFSNLYYHFLKTLISNYLLFILFYINNQFLFFIYYYFQRKREGGRDKEKERNLTRQEMRKIFKNNDIHSYSNCVYQTHYSIIHVPMQILSVLAPSYEGRQYIFFFFFFCVYKIEIFAVLVMQKCIFISVRS